MEITQSVLIDWCSFVFCRLLAISFGQNQLTAAIWEEAKEMERKKKERLPPKT
jgi:hypothetical protein